MEIGHDLKGGLAQINMDLTKRHARSLVLRANLLHCGPIAHSPQYQIYETGLGPNRTYNPLLQHHQPNLPWEKDD